MSEPVLIGGIISRQPASMVTGAVKIAARAHWGVDSVHMDALRRRLKAKPDASLAAYSTSLTETSGVRREFVASAGNPGGVLADPVNHFGALMTVGGTRNAGGGGVREFFCGSVGVTRANPQRCPVPVVPVDPISSDDAVLPWDEDRT